MGLRASLGLGGHLSGGPGPAGCRLGAGPGGLSWRAREGAVPGGCGGDEGSGIRMPSVSPEQPLCHDDSESPTFTIYGDSNDYFRNSKLKDFLAMDQFEGN